jgi:hypothetical protein
MIRAACLFALAASAIAALPVTACSGKVVVGSSAQQLQTRKDGQPTGNGVTCSWEGTAAYDTAKNKATANGTVLALPPPYAVGANFPALDGCNDCTCADKGIMCTVRACDGGVGSNDAGLRCTTEAKTCPGGSSVGRTGPNCEFAPCPASTCDALVSSARDELQKVLASHSACATDADCVEMRPTADCFATCSGVANKSGLSDMAAAKDRINSAQCKQFAAQGCQLVLPGCIPLGAPRCLPEGICGEEL